MALPQPGALPGLPQRHCLAGEHGEDVHHAGEVPMA